MSQRFTDGLRSNADSIWAAQHAHPFVRGIGDGWVVYHLHPDESRSKG